MPTLLNPGATRAEFLAFLSATGFALATGGCEQILNAIANRPTRKNIAGLASTDPILKAYRSAITAMQALPAATDQRNWTNQASIHFNHCPHTNWWLLPWHRAYLVYFERICQKLSGDSTFAIPYWNWTIDQTVPPVFYAGDVLDDSTDSGGGPVTVSTEFVAHSVLEPILAESNFLVFGSGQVAPPQRTPGVAGPLEATPHNHVHTSFPGDMATFMSPLDPIFWCHHAMLDFCWTDLKLARGFNNPSDATWNNMAFTDFVDENNAPVKVSTAITPLFPIFTYQYEPSQIGSQVDNIKAIRTQSEANHLKAIVQKGGPAQIPVLQRFSFDQASQVTVGASASSRIPATREALAAVADVKQGQRALLTLKNVDQPAKADFFVRVFVNAPGGVNAQTPITDPHYAGSFAFFVNGGKPMTMSMAGAGFMVDVTEAVRRLGASDGLDVQLVAVPYPGRNLTERGFSVGGLDLAIAKFTAPPAGG